MSCMLQYLSQKQLDFHYSELFCIGYLHGVYNLILNQMCNFLHPQIQCECAHQRYSECGDYVFQLLFVTQNQEEEVGEMRKCSL